MSLHVLIADPPFVSPTGWGSALACHTARLGHRVRIWAHEPEVVESINARRQNDLYLPGITFPDGVRASTDLGEVAGGAALLLLVTPSEHLRAVSARIGAHVSPDAWVVVASKGIEADILKLMSDVVAETLPGVGPERLAFLSGPSFAREVAAGQPADVVAASHRAIAARAVRPLLHTPTLRIYASEDPIGVQLGGALKNVIAIATGACDGLGLGSNARAALITRGLAAGWRRPLATCSTTFFPVCRCASGCSRCRTSCANGSPTTASCWRTSGASS